jgi:hypothetical protein
MIWIYATAGLLIAATMGAALAALLTSLRPGWSLARRRLVAASVLPAIVLVIALAVAMFGYSTSDPMMRSAIFTVILAWGAGFALLAFIGGYLGSLSSVRARRG